jgi:nucleoside phosphorylase
MSNSFADITKTQGRMQNSRSPIALAKVETPVLPLDLAFDNWGHPCVVILTAIAVECHAVCQHLTQLRQVKNRQNTIYECGQFESPLGQIWNVAVGEIGEGNAVSDRETERAITSFNPCIVLFVGVAGGIKDVQIGDVVAATKVYDYESGKEEEVFKPRPNVGLATYNLEQLAKATRRDWDRKRESGDHCPKVEIGAIASGSRVIASKKSEIYRLLKNNYGNVLAVEMEGFGLLDAVRANSGVSAIVIRGISDLIKGKAAADASGSQKLAAENASRFAFSLISKFATDIVPTNLEASRVEVKTEFQPTIVQVAERDNSGQSNTDDSTGFQTYNKEGNVYNAKVINVYHDVRDSEGKTASPEIVEFSGKAIPANLAEKFSPEIAILYVEKRGNEYCARIHNAGILAGARESENSVPPAISLSQLLENNLSPKAIKGKLDMICQKPQPNQSPTPIQIILDQVRKLLMPSTDTSKLQGISYLLIVDETDFEIPWEMLRLDRPDCYLGTALTTVRVRDVYDMEFMTELEQLSSDNHCCAGKVVIYADSDKMQALEEGVRVSELFQSHCFQEHNLFFSHLEQTSSDVGLVFIASHSSFQKNMDRISFGPRQGEQNVTLLELHTHLDNIELFRKSSSIVFMNAHHSGRLYQDEQNGRRIGFATHFLANGAKGVVGTLEEVNDTFAMQIAQTFFAKCSQGNNLTVAETLCLLRKESLDRIRKEGVNDETCAAFLYTFMYVYYGHPLARLQLTPMEQ